MSDQNDNSESSSENIIEESSSNHMQLKTYEEFRDLDF